MKDVNKTVVENKKGNAKLTRENQTKYHTEVDLIPIGKREGTRWDRIRELMKLTGDKLITIAKRLGYVDSTFLSKQRKDEQELSTVTIIKLAKHFKVSTDYLLGLTSFKNPYNMEETEQLEYIFHCLISTMLNFLPEDRRQPFMEKVMRDNK